jgi:tripartite-type tricarboxylate transporter receptor subunit TctC
MRSLILPAASLAVLSGFAHAQGNNDFPNKPIRIIVGYTAGTMADTVARRIGFKFTESWGQQTIIENREGASSTIAAAIAARATPDGYTLLMVGPAMLINPALMPVQYDFFRDFRPLSLVAVVPNVLVIYPQLPVRSVKELVAYAKAQPAPLQFSSSGQGTTSSLNGELFAVKTGIKLIDVPYRSSAQAMTDVISGQIPLHFPSLAPAMPHIQSGRLRALGVSSAKRAAAAPDIPPLIDSVPGYDVTNWYGVAVPAKTPPAIVAKLHREIVRSVQVPDVKEKFVALGADVVASNPEEFLTLWKVDQERWFALIKQLGIKPQ